jgi:addiction module HigA family antidote
MTPTATYPFRPDWAASAGEYLSIVLHDLGISQTELAARTGLSAKHVNQIIRKGASISPDVATQLEYVTGVEAERWASLDAKYQAQVARQQTRGRLEQWVSWLDQFDLKELAKRGAIPSSARTGSTVEALLRYFGIADPDGWKRVWEPSITSFRRSPSFTPDTTATTIWLRAGQLRANKIETEDYDPVALTRMLPELRALTVGDPGQALLELRVRLATVGVAVVYVAEFDGCRASGATWWATSTKAVVLLSDRGKREDRLWFSLFHELGHVLRHAKRDTFLDQNRPDEDDHPPWLEPAPASGFIDDGSRDSALEREADEFASSTLIPPEFAPRVSSLGSELAVAALAREIGVAPGIVAGRYQFETGNFAKFNKLRRPIPTGPFREALAGDIDG